MKRGTTLRRTPLGRSADFSGRQHVYEASQALEVDDFEGYAGQRRRVFYDEVLLVTRHRRVGWPVAVKLLLLAAFFGAAAGILALAEQVRVAIAVALAAVMPLLALAVLRLAVKLHVISVYGRRSQARVQFWMQGARARQVFEQVCARVRQAQEGGPP